MFRKNRQAKRSVKIAENRHYIGVNPFTVSYNACVLKIYNATSTLARFEKNSSTLKKRSNILQPWWCSCKIQSRIVVHINGSWSESYHSLN
jgi:hypothetical protein